MKSLTLFFLAFMLNISIANADSIVTICSDQAEWPPYTYMERTNGVPNKNKPQGAMVETLGKITEISGLEFQLTLIPWKRCIQEVTLFGKNRKIEVFMDGTFKDSRAKVAYVTAPVYTTTAGYWYSSKKFPDGPDIKTTSDLKKYTILGIIGNNYETYGFADNNGIDTGASSIKAALAKLAAGRGEIFVNSAPAIFGFEAIGENIIPENVVFKRLPDAMPDGFHLFISKDSPRAYELLTRINQAIITLEEHGTTDKIFKKFLSCGRNC